MKREQGETNASTRERSELLERQRDALDRVVEMIRSVDAKTTFAFAVNMALLGALTSFLPPPKEWTWHAAAYLALGATLPALGLFRCALATFPHLSAKKHSMLFFGTISEMSCNEYEAQVRSRLRDDGAYLNDLIAQTHRNAEIAAYKFGQVRAAMLVLFWGVLPWLASLYLLAQSRR